jgi:hypothetical protein
MKDEAHREEYVLNDHGRIWRGCETKMTVIPWNFGQVCKSSYCLYLITNNYLLAFSIVSLWLNSTEARAEVRGSRVRTKGRVKIETKLDLLNRL